MYLTTDYRDLIELFNRHKVKYLLVGAHAMAVFGHARSTYDIDIWIEREKENATRIVKALEEFGLPFELDENAFTAKEQIVQIGIAPNRIDLLTDIDGVAFSEAWERRKDIELDGMRLHILSAEDIVRNKVASGRPKDRIDAEMMKRLLQKDR
ncbi:DUF6036 family nucleotidyltransferase [Hydrogenimonas sp.]